MREQPKAGWAGRPGRAGLRDGRRRSALGASRWGVLPGEWGELWCAGRERGCALEPLSGNLGCGKIGDLCRLAVATDCSMYFEAAMDVPPSGVLGAAAAAVCSLESCRRDH